MDVEDILCNVAVKTDPSKVLLGENIYKRCPCCSKLLKCIIRTIEDVNFLTQFFTACFVVMDKNSQVVSLQFAYLIPRGILTACLAALMYNIVSLQRIMVCAFYFSTVVC